MKVLCTQHVDIRAPVEVVYDYVCDLARWPMWFACIVSAEQPEHRPLALDREVHFCMHAGRRRWQETFEVTRFIRNAFLSFEALYSSARRIDFRFERRGQRTRFVCSIGYRVYGGLLAAFLDLIGRRRRIAREVRDSLVHLKNMVEESLSSVAWSDDDLDLERVG